MKLLHLVQTNNVAALENLLTDNPHLDLNRRYSSGWTLLHSARSEGRTEIVRLLLAHGADANAQDVDGWAPLLIVCQRNHADLARLLLEHGAGVNARDKDGNTPLHAACRFVRPDIEMVRLLLAAGADPNAQNSFIQTPLDLLLQFARNHSGLEDIVELFRERAPELVFSAFCVTPMI